MPSKVQVIFDDVEVDAEKVIAFLDKSEKATPAVAAAVGLVFGAVSNAVEEGTEATAEKGANITLDVATFTAVKAVWPDIKSLLLALGIKVS